MNPIEFSPNVFYRPWIGKYYQEGCNGLKTLILGESHYKWEGSNGLENNPDLTNIHIDDVIRKKCTDRLLKPIFPALFGLNSYDDEERRRQSLKNVCFYNFIQKPLPDIKVRPTPDDFREALSPFGEVIKATKPDFILVCGLTLLRHISLPHDDIILNECQRQKKIMKLKLDGITAYAYGIRHPSSYFKADLWQDDIRRAVQYVKAQIE